MPLSKTYSAGLASGFYAVQAVFARDYPVVQAYVLIVAVLFVLVNLCVDLLQARIDPRARLALKQSAAQDRRGGAHV